MEPRSQRRVTQTGPAFGEMPFIPMGISRLPRWHSGGQALQWRKRCVGSRTSFTLEGTEDEVTRVATGDVTSGACLSDEGNWI
jgi:hypothetical protein